jgi:phosphatidylinositol alpha-1,6-mannosyltransferase
LQRVLFVSKPIAPPFHDGTKCLVRDVAGSLTRFRPVVLTTPQALSSLPAGVHGRVAYSNGGAFTPALADNARAALSVLGSREELWHFVFAPNPRTGLVARALRRMRRVPVVQTLASAPRHFAGLKQLLFGDELVVQSRATEQRLRDAARAEGVQLAPISVIPPPVPVLPPPSAEARARARAELGVGPGQQLLLYPGDLEVSSGADMTRRLVEPLCRHYPDAIVVFAYRQKTPAAAERAAALRASLDGQPVRITDRVSNMHALLAESALVLFPVDDLWGKVDQPIVLLEALSLGTPCLVLDQGPLRDVVGAVKVATLDERAWLEPVRALLDDHEARARVVADGRRAATDVYASGVVARAYESVYVRSLERRS